MYTALIIDTISIQPYIFGSNKLKENIGGSFIIEHLVYRKMIPLALKKSGISSSIDMDEWRKNNGKNYKLRIDTSTEVEIGYIGGGNAFLVFTHEDNAFLFIKTYSKLLLEYFPGLKTVYGLQDFNYEEGESYKDFRKILNKKLTQNRNQYPAQVLPFKHGIVEDCAWTNEAQEVHDVQSNTLISQMANSRIGLVEDAQKFLAEKFNTQLGDMYTFTTELDKLGQPDDKGYIAIVHADGNGMGKLFLECKSLAETRVLSDGVAKFADEVMGQLIGYIVALFNKENAVLNGDTWNLNPDKDKGRKILPIRPLIIGGDDITFVCEGRLGVHLAEKLLEYMTKTSVAGKLISACVGIAIVHTKSPFYKAYKLTEELTKKAKDASRPDNSSWLHFLISSGGFSGSYESIVRDQYTLPGKKILKAGPYRLDENGDSFQKMKEGMKTLLTEWPRNKQKDLRDVLRRDEANKNYFLAEIKARKLNLPGGKNELWQENATPFYDMVELLDFYPKELLNHEV